MKRPTQKETVTRDGGCLFCVYLPASILWHRIDSNVCCSVHQPCCKEGERIGDGEDYSAPLYRYAPVIEEALYHQQAGCLVLQLAVKAAQLHRNGMPKIHTLAHLRLQAGEIIGIVKQTSIKHNAAGVNQENDRLQRSRHP